jgi:hypothetical protein
MRIKCLVIVGLLVLATAPAWAQSASMDIPRFGFRVGVGLDPDQAIIGMQVNLGDIAKHLRFQPDLELGLGDDHTILAVTAPVHYRFMVDNSFTPYAGGGLTLGWVDVDYGRDSESDIELAAKAIGGLEWRTQRNSALFVQLSLVVGDIHDAEVMFGWTF